MWPSGSGGSGSGLSGGLGGLGSIAGLAGGFMQRSDARDQARILRRWTERMSNTAIQRRMADMRAAGINPVLAARFDASTPAASLAQMQNIGKAGVESGAVGVNSALAVVRQEQELKNLAAQERLTDAQAGKASQETALIRIRQRLTGYSADVAESASLFIQTLLGVIPPEFRNDPQKLGRWFRQKLQGFVSEHSSDVKNAKRFVDDASNAAVEAAGNVLLGPLPRNTDSIRKASAWVGKAIDRIFPKKEK